MGNKMLLPSFVFLCYLSIQCNNRNSANTENPRTAVIAAKIDSSKKISENLAADSSYSILAEALQSTGFMETLSQSGPFTIFAPSNQAFRDLPPGTYEGLMSNRKRDLANILSYHIVAGSIKTKEMNDGQKLRTMAGEELIVTLRNDRVLVNGIAVKNSDIEASNGIIHIIDGILFPRNQNPGAYTPQ